MDKAEEAHRIRSEQVVMKKPQLDSASYADQSDCGQAPRNELRYIMRNIYTLILLFINIATGLSQQTSFQIVTKHTLCFKEGNATYYLGMQSSTFINQFGPPEKKTSPSWTSGYLSGCSFLHYTTDGLSISIDSNGNIRGFTFYVVPSDEYKAANVIVDVGIKEGASARSIQKALGPPFKQQKVDLGRFDWLKLYYKYESFILEFSFDKGSFTSVGLYADYIPYMKDIK
jgi:hypothetical protein